MLTKKYEGKCFAAALIFLALKDAKVMPKVTNCNHIVTGDETWIFHVTMSLKL